jgi:hypothetical protein
MKTDPALMEILSLISSITSIVLAIIAIILSILFYRWSDVSYKETQKISSGIDSNTKKIESLFDKFYSDTFGLMKNNYEAMQHRILSEPISSGDSSQTDQEKLETVISSFILRVKTCTAEGINLALENLHPKKRYSFEEVNVALQSLEVKGSILIKDNLISIATPSGNRQDEGKNI